MTPTVSQRNVGRKVQPKVPSRFASTSVNMEEQLRQFREARKAREMERLLKARNTRLKTSTAAASSVSASMSITSSVSSSSSLLKPHSSSSSLPKPHSSSSSLPKPHSSSSTLPKPNSSINSCSSNMIQSEGRTQSSDDCQRPSNGQKSKGPANGSTLPHTQKMSSGNKSSCQTKLSKPRLPLINKGPGTAGRFPIQHRQVQSGRRSILKLKIDRRLPPTSKFTRKAPNAEVKLTKTAQLRMMMCDPLLELSQFSTSSSKHIVLPLPVPLSKHHSDHVKAANTGNNTTGEASEVDGSKGLKEIALSSPSRIPVRKTSFISPLRKMTPLTPKPSPLRLRLAEWLEKRDHSLDNFKHLKCFGILGPVVKRPQTPFRKATLSTSSLKVIPESAESTPQKEDSSEDEGALNTTFTLEDEDKENICIKEPVQSENAPNISQNSSALGVKELDQAHGVLSELYKLIQMGYPTEQCQLWLRAIRRRFPQCGDEPVYWECLASLEEARGDLQTAVSCYERALLQGAESSVQTSLEELLKKMSALNIEPILKLNLKKTAKSHENCLLESSNIIKSSAIQFAIQEKCNSTMKSEIQSDADDTIFTATPVRRSVRLAGTPTKGTPGVTCVRSLDFLEPKVRNSLIFHGNSALDPKD